MRGLIAILICLGWLNANAQLVISSSQRRPVVVSASADPYYYDTSTNAGQWLFTLEDGTNYLDSSGNDIDMESLPSFGLGATQIPRTNQEGDVTYSLFFDESDDILSAGDVLDIRTNDMCLAIWAKTTNTSQYGSLITKAEASGRTGRYALQMQAIDGGKIHALLDDGNAKEVISTNTFTDGAWHYIVANYERGANITIWADGVLQAASATINTDDLNITMPLQIGGFNNINPWGGELDSPLVRYGLMGTNEMAQRILYTNPTNDLIKVTP